ncbi:MAG: hypothetical protein JXR70_01410 [Spirochaetales bacterium]|nr:hypothetical protein [Spirochaetales bacterium]
MIQKSTLIYILTAAFLACCTPPPFETSEAKVDLNPPQLQDFSNSPKGLTLSFDENIELTAEDISFEPELEVSGIEMEKQSVTISTTGQIPGQEYTLRLRVNDVQGNSQDLLAAFYGYNPRLPKALINEFTTQGSSTHPDLVEIRLLEAGNIGGLCFFEGTRNNWDQRFVFPAMELLANDFLLLHTKPQGIPEEINEIQSPEISQGYDSSHQAYDFWLPQGTGLSANNGVLSLYSSPQGELIDGLVYSNRTSQSDEKYRGFGSLKTMERAEELFKQHGWASGSTEIRPEDAINPDDSTATRSMGRIPGSSDSNSAEDWMICASREASFGAENSAQVYKP